MKHRAMLASVLLAAAAPVARAQLAPALSLDPFPQGQFFSSTDKFTLALKRPLTNAPDTQTSMFIWDSYGRIRLQRAPARETLLDELAAPAIGYRVLDIELNPTTDRLPSALNDIALTGAIPAGPLGPGRLAFVAGAGYAGNSPFNDQQATYGIGHALYALPVGDHGTALLLSLDYNGHGSFLPDVPLPGIAFDTRRFDAAGNPNFWLHAGFPYTHLTWQPEVLDGRLSLDLRYTFPETAQARVELRVGGGISLFAAYENFLEGFRLDSASPGSTGRLFLQLRRAEIGVRVIHGKLVDGDLGIGYAFNQNLSTGYDARELTSQWLIPDKPFLTFALRGAF